MSRERSIGVAVIVAAALAAVTLLVIARPDDAIDVAASGTTTTTAGPGASTPDTSTASTIVTGDAATPGTTPCPAADGSSPKTLAFKDTFEACIAQDHTYTATFDTSEGPIVVDLDTSRTPNTSNSFVALSRFHYYDGTKLFRTVPSIGAIQGGSPNTQDNSDPGPGFNLPDEGGTFTWDAQGAPATPGPFQYEAGQLVMARSIGQDSTSAQFFFTANDAAKALDQQGVYIVFGTVTKGLDVLEKILALHAPADPADPNSDGAPSKDVIVKTVTITES